MDHSSDKLLLQIGKITGDEWKGMTDAQKAPYVEMAGKQKEAYQKQMEVYKQKKLEVCKMLVLYVYCSQVLMLLNRIERTVSNIELVDCFRKVRAWRRKKRSRRRSSSRRPCSFSRRRRRQTTLSRYPRKLHVL